MAGVEDRAAYAVVTAMNVWRGRRRRTAAALKRVVHRPAARDAALEDVDARDVTVRALSVLTPRERAAVVLTVLLDMTSDDAGKALGIGASTVRVLSNRGRARLRDALKEE